MKPVMKQYILEIYYENVSAGYPKGIMGMDTVFANNTEGKGLDNAGYLGNVKYNMEGYSVIAKEMKKKERHAYLAVKVKERREILAKIKKLTAERSKYIKDYIASRGDAKDAFDEEVLSILKEQAGRKGIEY